MLKLYLLLRYLLLTLLLLTCSDNKQQPNKSVKDYYFPLRVGNVWRFHSNNIFTDSLIITVKDSIYFGNRWFVFIEQRFKKGNKDRHILEFYWAHGENGEILTMDHFDINDNNISSKMINSIDTLYNPNANVGQTWITKPSWISKYPNIDSSFFRINELISKNEKIKLPNGNMYECSKYRVHFITNNAFSFIDWIAKDIGLVQRKYDFSYKEKIIVDSLIKDDSSSYFYLNSYLIK
ncbi:MAG: hypothetical protein ACYC09_08665 [Bacteroidota bacterium]